MFIILWYLYGMRFFDEVKSYYSLCFGFKIRDEKQLI